MRRIYLWQQEDWPHFTWDNDLLANKLARVRALQGKLAGKVSMLGFDLKKCSSDTALRDIQDLVAKGVLTRQGEGGRSTHYIINL